MIGRAGERVINSEDGPYKECYIPLPAESERMELRAVRPGDIGK